MGKTEKKRKENHATKVTKIPKTKKTKKWDERNKYMYISTVYVNCASKIKAYVFQKIQMHISKKN